MAVELDYKAIGKRVKIARIRKDYTQDMLAELTSLSNPHISNIENGGTRLSLKTLINVANVLEVSPNDLLCDNVDVGKSGFVNEIVALTDDCDEPEIRVISDTVAALKESLRARKSYFYKDPDTI